MNRFSINTIKVQWKEWIIMLIILNGLKEDFNIDLKIKLVEWCVN